MVENSDDAPDRPRSPAFVGDPECRYAQQANGGIFPRSSCMICGSIFNQSWSCARNWPTMGRKGRPMTIAEIMEREIPIPAAGQSFDWKPYWETSTGGQSGSFVVSGGGASGGMGMSIPIERREPEPQWGPAAQAPAGVWCLVRVLPKPDPFEGNPSAVSRYYEWKPYPTEGQAFKLADRWYHAPDGRTLRPWWGAGGGWIWREDAKSDYPIPTPDRMEIHDPDEALIIPAHLLRDLKR